MVRTISPTLKDKTRGSYSGLKYLNKNLEPARNHKMNVKKVSTESFANLYTAVQCLSVFYFRFWPMVSRESAESCNFYLCLIYS